ncbi:hypothetical protein GNI_134380 [Gregarina niphandrodes]|uniref:Uncharacterized protein n=1 Tax=Gregarina niphandrodes TaxID=110365 RepID=A0A023B1C1_GRENI|nr:hypothetical protein GNI_134380 [Gregarina niphandrodes]EZG46264.1 hypothetical protein GNI_134380 [Gregarina niphandrodes]|eukprot:XP_011132334.1 hypothetical protein GNI_134380 [Gregarina niphandrodes]
MKKALNPMIKNSSWGFRSCYEPYDDALCSIEIKKDYTPSASCKSTLRTFLKIANTCATPGTNCAGYNEDGELVNIDTFCTHGTAAQTDKDGQVKSIGFETNELTECRALAGNFQVCMDVGSRTMKLSQSVCLSGEWTGYCKYDLVKITPSSACRDVVIPSIIYAAFADVNLVNRLGYDGQEEAFCRLTYGLYMARLTRRRGDLVSKISAAYDLLQSCNSLLAYCEQEYIARSDKIANRFLGEVSAVRDSLGQYVKMDVNDLAQYRDPMGYDTTKLYIRAEDGQEFEDLMERIDHLVTYYDSHLALGEIAKDQWDRPVLSAVRQRLESIESVEDMISPIVAPLNNILQQAHDAWTKYPIVLKTDNTLSDLANMVSQSNAAFMSTPEPPKTVYLNDALANSTIAHSIAPSLIQTKSNALLQVTTTVNKLSADVCNVCSDLEQHYCSADAITAQSGNAFLAADLLIKTQLQL